MGLIPIAFCARRLIAGAAILLSVAAADAEAQSQIDCESEPTDMSVHYGELVRVCQITPFGDTDLFRFSGVSGDSAIVEANYVCCGTAFNPQIRLIAPNGDVMGDTWSPARLDLVLPQTGTYTAIVFDHTQSPSGGPYEFLVFCTRGTCVDAPAPAPPPTPVGSIQCEPEPTNMFPGFGTRVGCELRYDPPIIFDSDRFLFPGSVGDRILVELASTLYTVEGVHYPQVRLIAPDGRTLVETSSTAPIDVLLPETGTYIAEVFTPDKLYAPYWLTVSCTAGSCLRPGPEVVVTLTGCRVCRAGDLFTVQVRWSNPGPSRLAEVKLGVRYPDGSTLNLYGGKHLEVFLPAGFDQTTTLASFPWQSGQPIGTWTLEATLSNPDVGELYSRGVEVFTVAP